MRVLFLLIFLALPLAAEAVTAPRTFAQLANIVIQIINAGIGVALMLGIVIYFYGLTSSLQKTRGGEISQLRTHIIWGIAALFIMFSVWGITGLIRNTLFGRVSTSSGYGSTDTNALCNSIDGCDIRE